MAITEISRDTLTQTVDIIRITATNTLAQVGTAGYLTAQASTLSTLNNGTFEFVASDFFLVYATDGWGFFSISSDFTSLTPFVFSTDVTGATVVGDFPQFNSTSGNLIDNGKLPSDDTKTRVVMAGSAVQTGYLAHFVDTTGTIDDTAGAVINAGTIQSGLSGTVGGFIAYPATAARGTLRLTAVNNTGNTATTISNAAMGQASVISIPDPATATANFVIAPAALTSGNFLAASGTAGLAVDSGFAAANILRTVSIAVTAAEFNGMYAAPKLLIAAPGANSLIIVESMQLVMTYVSANYASGGVVFAQYDSTANGAGVKATNTEAAADFQAAASTTFAFIGTSGNTVGVLPFTTTVNKGLYLSNATGAFTTGDSTFVVKVFYRIIATA